MAGGGRGGGGGTARSSGTTVASAAGSGARAATAYYSHQPVRAYTAGRYYHTAYSSTGVVRSTVLAV